ncbi:MAG: hypothetical protein PVG11_06180 [Anaerolineae bacterium]|jgi:hypothetical protein
MDERIHGAILERLDGGKLPCAEAHTVARQFDVDPLVVGETANQADIRINRCQLGLFGYGPKVEGKHKIVHPMDDVPENLAARLRAASTSGGITCADIWAVADAFRITRLEASSAVEAMGLRVSRCQLGCFSV